MDDTSTPANGSDSDNKLAQDTTNSTNEVLGTAADTKNETDVLADDKEMAVDSTENKDQEQSNDTNEVVMETDADKNKEKADGDSDKEDKDAEEINTLTEEEMRIYRDIMISAVTETITIKPFTLNNIQDQNTILILSKARDFTLEFKEKEGTLTCRFEPNRDWRAKFVIKGINKLLSANPDMTIECASLFRQLLDQDKEGKPIGLFHTQMAENKSLYVGGVPQDTTEAQLLGFFPKSTKLHLPCHLNGAVRGWAVVEFDTPEDAEESITTQKTFVIGDNTATVVRLKKHPDPRNRRAKLSRRRRERARAVKKDQTPNQKKTDNKRKGMPSQPSNRDRKKMRFQSGNSPSRNTGHQNGFGKRKNYRMPGKSSLLGMGPIMRGMGSSMSRMGSMGGMSSTMGLGAGFGGMGSNMGMASLLGNMGMNNMGGMGTNMGMSGMGSMVSGIGMSGMRGDNMNMSSGQQWAGGMASPGQMNQRRLSRRERKNRRNRNNSEGSQHRTDKSDQESRKLQTELSSKIDKVVSGERQGKGSDEDMVAMLQTALQAVQRRLGDSGSRDSGDSHSISQSGSDKKPQGESNRQQSRNQGNRRDKWGQGSQYSGSGGGYGGSGGYGESRGYGGSGGSPGYDYNRSSSYDSYDRFDSGRSYHGSSHTSGSGSYGNDPGRFSSSGSMYGGTDTYSGGYGGGTGGSSYSSYDTGSSRGNIWDSGHSARPHDGALHGVFSNYQSGYNYKY